MLHLTIAKFRRSSKKIDPVLYNFTGEKVLLSRIFDKGV